MTQHLAPMGNNRIGMEEIMRTYTIDMTKALPKLRKAWKERRVAAQHAEIQECLYRYEGRPGIACAIGCMLPDKVARGLMRVS